MCTEASFLPTGYGVYTKELLSRLYNHPEFEVAELACYTDIENPKILEIPWQVFANKPTNNSPELESYHSNPANEYGEFTFNTVCLQYKPDYVIDIRDPWVFEYQVRSPFRDYFNHIIMPTVDASPQSPEWIDMFSLADGVLAYSEFGYNEIKQRSSNVNLLGVASPAASDDFCVLNDLALNRAKLDLPEDVIIFGTVMRNQRRKLYPDLFKSFRKYLDQTKSENSYLYCHLYFPDVGWEIPELIMEYNLSNKVIFTYKCGNCERITASFFKDSVTFCNHCKSFNNALAGLNNKLTDKELNQVYNCFDYYIQYANSEGFGMPQVEAAQAGIPIAGVNYSAMSSILTNLNGVKLPVLMLSKECETGCDRAIPNNADFIQYLIERKKQTSLEQRIEISNLTKQKYNWDKVAETWINAINKIPPKDVNKTWRSEIKQIPIIPIDHNQKTPMHQANFLIGRLLQKPEWIGGRLWRRTLKDLTYGKRLANAGGFYFNESHIKDQVKTIDFSYQDAYNEIVKLIDYYNIWESHRRSFE